MAEFGPVFCDGRFEKLYQCGNVNFCRVSASSLRSCQLGRSDQHDSFALQHAQSAAGRCSQPSHSCVRLRYSLSPILAMPHLPAQAVASLLEITTTFALPPK